MEANFIANQHQIIKGIFELQVENSKHQSGIAELKHLNTIYQEQFGWDKFKLKGLPNRTLQLEIRDVALRLSADLEQTHSRSDNSKGTQIQTTRIDQIVTYESVVLDIQIFNDTGKYDYKARLLKVQFNASQQSMKDISNNKGTDSQSIKSSDLIQILNAEVESRLIQMHNFTAHQWWELLPYGLQLHGGFLHQFLKVSHLTINEKDIMFCMAPFGGEKEIATDDELVQSEEDRAKSKELSQFKLILDQEGVNAQLDLLHQSEELWAIPLDANQTGAAIELLKEELELFRDATHFEVSAFANQQVFEKYWNMDDVPKSHIEIFNDANVTFRLNGGAEIKIYRDSDLIDTLTVLAQIQGKAQLSDPARTTVSKGKKRPWLKLHSLSSDEVEVYNSAGDLLEQESMVAIVGLMRVFKGFLASFQRRVVRDSLETAKLYSYIGDMNLEQPRDQIGIHWARVHLEETKGKSVSLVADLETESQLVDPARYEENFEYHYKKKVLLIKEHTVNELEYFKPMKTKRTCWDNLMLPFNDFVNQWCKEEVEAEQLGDGAYERCQHAWCFVHSSFYYDDLFYSRIEIFGVVYMKRQLIKALVHLALTIALYFVMKKIWKGSQKTTGSHE